MSDSFPWRNVLKVRPRRGLRQKPIFFFFYGGTTPHGMGRPLSFIRLSVDGQLEYFHLVATVNSAAVNTGVQASESRSQDKHLAAARPGGVAACLPC